MGKYFGTDGFRGEANIGLTVDHALRIGRFLGHYYSQEKKARIVIGKDTRLSSYMLEDALAAGITQVVFDRSGYIYTGRVASLADGAREAGLKF